MTIAAIDMIFFLHWRTKPIRLKSQVVFLGEQTAKI